MTAIFIILVWLLIAFVVGVTFGKFCAAGNGLDTRCLSKLDIKFDTLVDNLTPIEDQAEEVAQIEITLVTASLSLFSPELLRWDKD